MLAFHLSRSMLVACAVVLTWLAVSTTRAEGVDESATHHALYEANEAAENEYAQAVYAFRDAYPKRSESLAAQQEFRDAYQAFQTLQRAAAHERREIADPDFKRAMNNIALASDEIVRLYNLAELYHNGHPPAVDKARIRVLEKEIWTNERECDAIRTRIWLADPVLAKSLSQVKASEARVHATADAMPAAMLKDTRLIALKQAWDRTQARLSEADPDTPLGRLRILRETYEKADNAYEDALSAFMTAYWRHPPYAKALLASRDSMLEMPLARQEALAQRLATDPAYQAAAANEAAARGEPGPIDATRQEKIDQLGAATRKIEDDALARDAVYQHARTAYTSAQSDLMALQPKALAAIANDANLAALRKARDTAHDALVEANKAAPNQGRW